MGKKAAAAPKRQQNQKQNINGQPTHQISTVVEDRTISKKSKKENRGRRHQKFESASNFHDLISEMFRNYKAIFFSFTIVAAAGAILWYNSDVMDIVTPLGVPKVIDQNPSNLFHSRRFWGSYRSGVYFGMKARSPSSPNFGLMWMTQPSMFPPEIRHWCNQGDGLERYGWLAHDGVNFGIHEAVDKQYSIKSSFIKQPGGKHGGEWTAKIHLTPKMSAPKDLVVSLFLYMVLDNDNGKMTPQMVRNGVNGISGYAEGLGSYNLHFRINEKFENSFIIQNHLITKVPKNIGDLKSIVMDNFEVIQFKNAPNRFIVLQGTKMPNGVDVQEANFIVSQLTVRLPFEIEVIYQSESSERNELFGEYYDTQLQKYETEFDAKFEKVFHLETKKFSTSEINFAKSTFSNLIGGIGYFYGSSLVKSEYVKEPIPYWDASLYTAVPSRSFFPRGFLWDEGFHNLLISQWDTSISTDIIGHWLDLMNVEGWIAREQILGYEALARVPNEFVIQSNENANPPTLFLTLEKFLKDDSFVKNQKPFLQLIFPRLVAWYNWYNKTQISPKYYSAYYWRGRNATTTKELNPKTLTSGLDDFPRASHPSEHERHLDLRCWIAYMSGILSKVAQLVKSDHWKSFEETHRLLSDAKLLNELHWSESKGIYSDFGLHSDKVELKRPPKTHGSGQRHHNGQQPQEKVRITIGTPVLRMVDSEFGYVNLFPFLLKILEPSSPQLGKILSDIANQELLWTPFGLRSLSRISRYYRVYNTEHDPPYWRGSIWININYLAVAALKHYHLNDGPYSLVAGELYQNLRMNLIKNLHEQYLKTGYIWEQYDDVTGAGRGSHPFTGWSSLVVLIMSEQY